MFKDDGLDTHFSVKLVTVNVFDFSQ